MDTIDIIDLCIKMCYSSGVTFYTRCITLHHYSDETGMEHARDLYVDGDSREVGY